MKERIVCPSHVIIISLSHDAREATFGSASHDSHCRKGGKERGPHAQEVHFAPSENESALGNGDLCEGTVASKCFLRRSRVTCRCSQSRDPLPIPNHGEVRQNQDGQGGRKAMSETVQGFEIQEIVIMFECQFLGISQDNPSPSMLANLSRQHPLSPRHNWIKMPL
jgi:hypothetical protein